LFCNDRCSYRYKERKNQQEHGFTSGTIKRREKLQIKICFSCNSSENKHRNGCSQRVIKLKEHVSKHGKSYRQYLRDEVIKHYGNQCACCGEKRHEFLAVDHIFGKGKSENRRGGWTFYLRIKREGYPKDVYRLLCHNCNISRGHYGYCPHEREKTGQLDLQMIPGA
jgi:hypothetical protein